MAPTLVSPTIPQLALEAERAAMHSEAHVTLTRAGRALHSKLPRRAAERSKDLGFLVTNTDEPFVDWPAGALVAAMSELENAGLVVRYEVLGTAVIVWTRCAAVEEADRRRITSWAGDVNAR